jgi:MipA family protein
MNLQFNLKSFLPLSLCLLGSLASAQSFDAVRLFSPAKGNGSGSVGLMVLAGREYMGSDERRNLVLPAVNYRWKNGWFAGTGNGVGYLFDSAPQVQYGLRLTADLGRRSVRSAVLNGLPNIKPSPELGGFFNLFLSREVFFTSSLRLGSGRENRGAVFDFGANYAAMVSPQFRLGLGVATSVVNRSYMQSYFGVAGAQATADRAAFDARAGVRDVRVSGSLSYFVNADWTAMAGLSATSLQGDAHRSPLTKDRSPISAFLMVLRDF